MGRNTKLMVAAVLLLVFAAAKLAALGWWQAQQAQTKQAAPCRVSRGCTLPNGVYVKFSDTVRAKQPFDIVLKNVPENIEKVTVSFTMKDMDMGFNRFELVRQNGGTWSAAHIRLPVCVENRRDYLADIDIGGQVFQTAFSAQ